MTMTKRDLLAQLENVSDDAVIIVYDGSTDGLMDWTSAKTVDKVYAFVEDDVLWFSKGAAEGSVPAVIIN